jgi:hypothetical protein
VIADRGVRGVRHVWCRAGRFGYGAPQARSLGAGENRMIRPFATEIALFLTPFAIYAVFLLATKAGALHPDAWSLPKVALLVIASFLLMIGSFLVLAQFSGAPPGSTYVPAHMKDGEFVPGQNK